MSVRDGDSTPDAAAERDRLVEVLENLVNVVEAHNHYFLTGRRTAFARGKYVGPLEEARATLSNARNSRKKD